MPFYPSKALTGENIFNIRCEAEKSIKIWLKNLLNKKQSVSAQIWTRYLIKYAKVLTKLDNFLLNKIFLEFGSTI